MIHITLFYLNAAACAVSVGLFAADHGPWHLLSIGLMNAFCALSELRAKW